MGEAGPRAGRRAPVRPPPSGRRARPATTDAARSPARSTRAARAAGPPDATRSVPSACTTRLDPPEEPVAGIPGAGQRVGGGEGPLPRRPRQRQGPRRVAQAGHGGGGIEHDPVAGRGEVVVGYEPRQQRVVTPAAEEPRRADDLRASVQRALDPEAALAPCRPDTTAPPQRAAARSAHARAAGGTPPGRGVRSTRAGR